MSRRKQTKPLRLNEDDPQQQNGKKTIDYESYSTICMFFFVFFLLIPNYPI